MSSIILNNSIAVESMDKGPVNKLEGQKIQAEKSSNVETSKESNANQKVEQNTKAEKNVTPDLTNEQLKMVAQQLQDFMGEMNKGLLFSVDKDSGRDVIKVIDKKNGDLIKQYPTEQVLEMVSKLSDATGSLVNEKI
jgi:flagellar protein FlaG